LPARELILDGEVIALRADGSPHPFQVTMRRFGRKLDVEGLRAELPLSPFFFDLLWLDGRELLSVPHFERATALAKLAPAEQRVERLVTADPEAAERFFVELLARGHEGVMAKALDAPYEAGSRGSAWLKVKQAKTLDLVVLAAEWGSGRRHGWLSNLHLGARDPGAPAERGVGSAGGFVMLGKTFKGMTDEVLAWQTERLLQLAERREGHVVHVRPELVVEIAYNDLQASPHYPGGLALRFARLKGYRPDKTAAEADTIETVREAYRRATGLEAG
jgi:DNA ligase-1